MRNFILDSDCSTNESQDWRGLSVFILPTIEDVVSKKLAREGAILSPQGHV
jgi:hypothetical protein